MGLPFEEEMKISKKNLGGELMLNRASKVGLKSVRCLTNHCSRSDSLFFSKQKSQSREKMGLTKHSSSDELLTSPSIKKCIRSDYGSFLFIIISSDMKADIRNHFLDAGLDAWPSKTIAFDDWPEVRANFRNNSKRST